MVPIPTILMYTKGCRISNVEPKADTRNTPTDNDSLWSLVNRKAEELTKETHKNWTDEVTNLLVFASLFSAILASFTVEAGKAIKADPTEKATILLQTLILQVVNNLSPQANPPIDLMANLNSIITITPQTRHIHLFYSVSLTLSLAAVLAGLLCLQWLRQFGRSFTVVSHDSNDTDFYLQYQRHKSLKSWGVIALLNTLPLLLIIALFLFFAGFLLSQWESNSNSLAAIPITIIVAITCLFVFVTSCLPALQVIWLVDYSKNVFDPSDDPPPTLCPYRSPQAWLIHSMLKYLVRIIKHIHISSALNNVCHCRLMPFDEITSWNSYDTWWTEKHRTSKSIYPALHWVATEFKQNKNIVLTVYRCFLSAITDTCCEYLPTFRQRLETTHHSEYGWQRSEVPCNAWTTWGLDTMATFEKRFIPSDLNSAEITDLRFRTFAKIWGVLETHDLLVDRPHTNIYKILHIETRNSNNNAVGILKAMTNALADPRGMQGITRGTVVAIASHVIHHDWRYWEEVIPVLNELCKWYKRGGYQFEDLCLIQTLCDHLREAVGSKHGCAYLIHTFNRASAFVEAQHLDLAVVLSSLLVTCNFCHVNHDVAKAFLEIIQWLVACGHIPAEKSLDNIFLYTIQILHHSIGLSSILPCIDETFRTLLAAAEDYVQSSGASIHSVLHPNQLAISCNGPHPMYPNEDLETIWFMINDFNRKLREIWAPLAPVGSGSGLGRGKEPLTRKP